MPLPPDIVDLLHHAEKTSANKSLAVPQAGQPPDFSQVATVVLSSVQSRYSIGILCLTEEIMNIWLNWPPLLAPSLTAFDLLNLNEASLLEWQNFLGRQPYALTVLHGACAELAAGRVTVSYVMALVNAVPAGLVVVA